MHRLDKKQLNEAISGALIMRQHIAWLAHKASLKFIRRRAHEALANLDDVLGFLDYAEYEEAVERLRRPNEQKK